MSRPHYSDSAPPVEDRAPFALWDQAQAEYLATHLQQYEPGICAICGQPYGKHIGWEDDVYGGRPVVTRCRVVATRSLFGFGGPFCVVQVRDAP